MSQPVQICHDFRGELRGELPIAGVPAGVEFRPGYIAHRAGQLYLADLAAIRRKYADALIGDRNWPKLAELAAQRLRALLGDHPQALVERQARLDAALGHADLDPALGIGGQCFGEQFALETLGA